MSTTTVSSRFKPSGKPHIVIQARTF
eukprot:COSAG04_NODE_19615_length_412_cov_0.661342_1_plen_25_part_10